MVHSASAIADDEITEGTPFPVRLTRRLRVTLDAISRQDGITRGEVFRQLLAQEGQKRGIAAAGKRQRR